MKKFCIALLVSVLSATADTAKPIPAFLFGQNIEHTRSAVQGGLSAQLVRNRKFAGKPARNGVLQMWEAYGTRAVYEHKSFGCTRHAARSRMFRQNEIGCQMIGSLDKNGEAGIRQGNIGLRGGIPHEFKAVVRTVNPEAATMVLRVTSHGHTLAEKEFIVDNKNSKAWPRISLSFTPPSDCTAEISIGVKGRNYCLVGAVSLMPADNFRGMRADAIEHMRELGTSYIRWPGGNFAGDYRWRDGLIADPDERAPIQSYMEIETQSHSLGYDSNDIGMEDILALCEQIGAEPIFTINAVWETPQDSVDWLKVCKGRVKMWSLGNEMGYAHMEGPKGPNGYVRTVRPHAEALLKEDPSLVLVSSGHFPWGGAKWVDGAAKPLADVARVISYHRYENPGTFDFSTPERTAAFYANVSRRVDMARDNLLSFRKLLPPEISISYDEWNIWYFWFREEGIVEGLFAAKFMHMLMTNWETAGLSLACYFQPINEGAICVSPFKSHLTSAGEAMRLWKGHIDGVPVDAKELPRDAFATDAADGSRYATFYNFSTTSSQDFRISAGNRKTVLSGEMLIPCGLETGCRYSRRPIDGKLENGFYILTLAPASQAAVRLK